MTWTCSKYSVGVCNDENELKINIEYIIPYILSWIHFTTKDSSRYDSKLRETLFYFIFSSDYIYSSTRSVNSNSTSILIFVHIFCTYFLSPNKCFLRVFHFRKQLKDSSRSHNMISLFKRFNSTYHRFPLYTSICTCICTSICVQEIFWILSFVFSHTCTGKRITWISSAGYNVKNKKTHSWLWCRNDFYIIPLVFKNQSLSVRFNRFYYQRWTSSVS